jgi:tetratricopeptide (TPR) repeat protein
MSTTSEVATPLKRSVEPPTNAPTRQSRLPGLQFVGVFAALGLLGFNAWWYWRDNRSLPDLGTISRFISREQYAQAEPALREHLRRSPHDGDARMMLARVYAARGDLLGCARQLQQVPYWWPQKWEALYREGQSYLMIDRAREAERSWLDVIKDDPLHPVSEDIFHDTSQELLKLYAIQDRWDDAYPVIWTGYDRAPASEKLTWLIMRMRAELERVSPKESITQLRRYVAASPDDWESLRALAHAELALGDRGLAERNFQGCLKGRPDDVRAWHDYLAMLLEGGELERFLELLRTAPPSADIEPETWFFRGIATEKAGDLQTAAMHFRKAIELNPFLAKAYYRLAAAEERLGLRDQAVIHRKKSKVINEARGQFPAAYSGYLTSLNSDGLDAPGSAVAARRVATICETLGWSRAAAAWNRLANSP